MSAPADRPLSLARVKALPVGARVADGKGVVWRRVLSPSTGRPGWFRQDTPLGLGVSSSPTNLWADHGPVTVVSIPEPAGDGG